MLFYVLYRPVCIKWITRRAQQIFVIVFYQNVISIGQHEEENRIRGFILEKEMPGLTAPKVNKCIIACKQKESWQMEKKLISSSLI